MSRKATKRILESLQLSSYIGESGFPSIAEKLALETTNAYEEVALSSEEESICEAVSIMLAKPGKLIDLLKEEIQTLESKIQKASEQTKSKSLYGAPLCRKRVSFRRERG